MRFDRTILPAQSYEHYWATEYSAGGFPTFPCIHVRHMLCSWPLAGNSLGGHLFLETFHAIYHLDPIWNCGRPVHMPKF